jgi:hypothetical protein
MRVLVELMGALEWQGLLLLSAGVDNEPPNVSTLFCYWEWLLPACVLKAGHEGSIMMKPVTDKESLTFQRPCLLLSRKRAATGLVRLYSFCVWPDWPAYTQPQLGA